MAPQSPRMMIRPQMQAAPGPVPGSHPVILRANSPATPGTIQDTLPPALPVQRIPNPHGFSGGTGSLHPGGPPRGSGGPPNASVAPSGPPHGPGGYPGPYGAPSGPRPMYPGSPA